MGKLVGGCASAFVLGAQLVAPALDHGWYWPFVAYPMYSAAKRPGEPVRRWELVARPCGPAAAARVVTHADLGFEFFHLDRVVTAAVGLAGSVAEARPTAAVADSAAALLAAVAGRRLGPAYCALELRMNEFVLGRDSPVRFDRRFRPVRTLGLGSAGAGR